ncbi:uncharacterized protein LOC135820258 [Sycon ciliatum]|uniref:uncharacterized protein LOC135820258 n=1 Tax=Sycon ciliatum TaxID=27933 RepID=UPI0031F69CBB
MADGAWISSETEDEIYDRALVLGRKDIRNEFERLEKNPPDGCYIKANHDDDDLLYWEATVFGPKGSLYEGGVFDITLKCIAENPFVLPDVTFITNIYHPIVKRHSKICEWCLLRNVDAYNSGSWHKSMACVLARHFTPSLPTIVFSYQFSEVQLAYSNASTKSFSTFPQDFVSTGTGAVDRARVTQQAASRSGIGPPKITPLSAA